MSNSRTSSLSPTRATRRNSFPAVDDTLHFILMYRRATAPLILCKYAVSSDMQNVGYADVMIKIIAHDPPESVFTTGVLSGFKVVQHGDHQLVFGQDSDDICCVVATGLRYKSRVSIQLLQELYTAFMAEFQDDALEATPGHSLESNSFELMENIVKLYSNHKMVVMKRKEGFPTNNNNQGLHLLSPVSSTSQREMEQMIISSTHFSEKEEQLSERMEARRKKRDMLENIIWVLCMFLVMVAVITPILVEVLSKEEEFEEIMAETEQDLDEGYDPIGVP